MKTANDLITDVLALSRRMMILSDQGNLIADDNGCRLLFSVLADCAYKVRHQAEREKEAHRLQGETALKRASR